MHEQFYICRQLLHTLDCISIWSGLHFCLVDGFWWTSNTKQERCECCTYGKMRILLKKIRIEQAILLWRWNCCFCLKSMFLQVQPSSQPHSFSVQWCSFWKGSLNVIIMRVRAVAKSFSEGLKVFRSLKRVCSQLVPTLVYVIA